ncbi:hypothetical protein EBZ80_05695 [bacterium]|nr:hypothetical protein [bacterium]
MKKVTAARQLQKLHESLYRRAHADANALGAGPSGKLVRYAEDFERSLPRSFSRVSNSHLIETVLRRRIVLFGDFHTFKQTQRALLRLLRDVLSVTPRPKIVLALEFLKNRYQKQLESWMAGEISEEEFLQAVNYSREWGFPWNHYKPLLELARDHMMPVICVNSDHPGPRSLEMRDRTCARLLASASEDYPDHIIVCMIGEYHLADNHLPATLWNELARRDAEASTPLMRILCNVDRYYFDLEGGGTTVSSTEVLRLKRDMYCVVNSPPWMKWQSFAIWEEMRTGFPGSVEHAETGQDGDEDHADDDAFDLDFQFLGIVQTLSSFLGLDIPKRDLAKFHSQFSPTAEFTTDPLLAAGCTKNEVSQMVERAALEGYWFDCRTRTLLITTVSINNLAEAAGQYLLALSAGFSEHGQTEMDRFSRNALKHAAGIIGSKILNPRRKTKDMAFHVNYVDQTARRRLLGYAKIRRQVSRSVLSILETFDALPGTWDGGRPSRQVSSLLQTENLSRGEVSADFGRLLGAGVYSGVMRNRVPAEWIKRLFRNRISQVNPASVLLGDFVRVVTSLNGGKSLNRPERLPAAS